MVKRRSAGAVVVCKLHAGTPPHTCRLPRCQPLRAASQRAHVPTGPFEAAPRPATAPPFPSLAAESLAADAERVVVLDGGHHRRDELEEQDQVPGVCVCVDGWKGAALHINQATGSLSGSTR